MKKISAVLLIAVLASGLVFAGITGNAQVGFGGNLDNGAFGFIDNSTNVTFNIDVATADAAAKANGDIYAEINGSVKLYLSSGEKGNGSMDDPSGLTIGSDGKGIALGVQAEITSAKIAGSNWYVSLLGVPGGPDFAKSAVDTYDIKKQYDDLGLVKKDKTKNATYSVGYSKAPGVEVGVAGYKIGLGLYGMYDKNRDFMKSLNATAYAMTPEYALADGMTLQVGAVYSQKYLDPDNSWTAIASPAQAVGGSVKFAYASDSVKASVASDIGYDIIKGASNVDADKKNAFGADVALNVAVAPVTVDVYYATRAKTGETPQQANPKKTDSTYTTNLVSAKVVADLNNFDIPVKLTVTGKDLIAKQNLALAVEVVPVEDLTLTVKGGYVIANNGRTGEVPTDLKNVDPISKWSAGFSAKYAMDALTVSGGFDLRNASTSTLNPDKTGLDKDSLVIAAQAAVESTTLIPGATLKLAWAGDDLTKTLAASETADDDGRLGKVIASVKVAF